MNKLYGKLKFPILDIKSCYRYKISFQLAFANLIIPRLSLANTRTSLMNQVSLKSLEMIIKLFCHIYQNLIVDTYLLLYLLLINKN